MGQKIHPHGFRLGPLFTWGSRWYATDKHYKQLLVEDIKLREMLILRLKSAGISRVEIERSINKIDVIIMVSRPGLVIGRGGTGLEVLKKFVNNFLKRNGKRDNLKIELRVEPVKEPNLDAHIVAATIADQLLKRLPHKRIVNQAIERVMAAGAKGARIMLSGRIAGAEISRREKYQKGTVPLSTIREEIDYAQTPSHTKSGYIGVKVWIAKGERKSI